MWLVLDTWHSLPRNTKGFSGFLLFNKRVVVRKPIITPYSRILAEQRYPWAASSINITEICVTHLKLRVWKRFGGTKALMKFAYRYRSRKWPRSRWTRYTICSLSCGLRQIAQRLESMKSALNPTQDLRFCRGKCQETSLRWLLWMNYITLVSGSIRLSVPFQRANLGLMMLDYLWNERMDRDRSTNLLQFKQAPYKAASQVTNGILLSGSHRNISHDATYFESCFTEFTSSANWVVELGLSIYSPFSIRNYAMSSWRGSPLRIPTWLVKLTARQKSQVPSERKKDKIRAIIWQQRTTSCLQEKNRIEPCTILISSFCVYLSSRNTNGCESDDEWEFISTYNCRNCTAFSRCLLYEYFDWLTFDSCTLALACALHRPCCT